MMFRFIFMVGCFAGSLPLSATPIFTELKTQSIWQQSVHYRLGAMLELTDIKANLGNQPVDFESRDYPYRNAKTAVLILVDTSDPRRQATLTRIGKTLDTLIVRAKPHFQFGLASFDSELKSLKDIGTDRAEIQASCLRLEAQGKTTELYRNTLKAIDILVNTPAERRVLWLFSDGIAEDTDYTSSEVVALALRHHVILVGFGYPKSVTASIHLQNMRRFATETGGLFMKVNAKQQLPPQFYEPLFQHLDNGGQLVFNFSADQGQSNPLLSIQWITSSVLLEKQWPLTFPKRVITTPIDAPTVPNSTPYLLIALIVLLIFWLIIWLRHRVTITVVYAYLEMVVSGEYIPITDKSFTMGRGKDNHLVLANDSVSLYHAVLHNNREGEWLISDLDSINGIYVDDEKINHYTLAIGDAFELGEVKLRLQLGEIE